MEPWAQDPPRHSQPHHPPHAQGPTPTLTLPHSHRFCPWPVQQEQQPEWDALPPRPGTGVLATPSHRYALEPKFGASHTGPHTLPHAAACWAHVVWTKLWGRYLSLLRFSLAAAMPG